MPRHSSRVIAFVADFRRAEPSIKRRNENLTEKSVVTPPPRITVNMKIRHYLMAYAGSGDADAGILMAAFTGQN